MGWKGGHALGVVEELLHAKTRLAVPGRKGMSKVDHACGYGAGQCTPAIGCSQLLVPDSVIHQSIIIQNRVFEKLAQWGES